MSTLTPITLISVCRPHSHILGSWVGGALQSRLTVIANPSSEDEPATQDTEGAAAQSP